MMLWLTRVARNRSGATAIEYGLIAAFVALAIVATLPSIRSSLAGVFGGIDRELSQAARSARPGR
ncbi:MAG: Flp family type IVb pilin [Sphingomonadaceae bacterium]|uniref:Flp family type IVb pilin n=1 Tax=Thermaurantiacus sp. TaxID=2820283 RepID=UPI00298F0E51|nr:Flp family type IVb pilin [Thermaurantiacus sp.]MCS6987732.1 Flp family type IVb pilin [Sphingomonadaceae bacterium]MDW8415048.1 Flp family type IVb pilin [Thermaurantiacus sp.]